MHKKSPDNKRKKSQKKCW